MSDSPKKKKRKSTSTDKNAFIIAIIIILSFIAFSGILILIFKDIEAFKDISAIWGVWVGIVIGYFFGSRKVETLTDKVDEFMNNMECSYDDYEKEYKELENDFNDVEKKYEKAKQELQHIVSSNIQNIDKDLLKKLKDEHDIIINEK